MLQGFNLHFDMMDAGEKYFISTK